MKPKGETGHTNHNTGPWIALMVAAVLLAACVDSRSPQADEQLIRIGESSATVRDYSKALESAKAAYPHALLQDPALIKAVQSRVLKELTDQLIFEERAKELGIHISETEVEQAAARIQADYPEGTFQQTLLENAVSYPDWRDGLKRRLLMEKVVDRELKDQIVITAEEIAAFIEAHRGELSLPEDGSTDDTNEMIVRNLRRLKTEQAYTDWMNGLQVRYRIEVNKDLWGRLTGS